MEVAASDIFEEFDKDLFWVRIDFMSDDKSSKTRILACISWEYLIGLYHVRERKEITESNRAKWLENVIQKWTSKGLDIFNQETHYDVYAGSSEGNMNSLAFLKKLS